MASAASLWQLLGDGSLVLAVSLRQVLPGYFVAANRFIGLYRSVLVGFCCHLSGLGGPADAPVVPGADAGVVDWWTCVRRLPLPPVVLCLLVGLWFLLGESLSLEPSLLQLLGDGSSPLAALLRQVLLGGLLALVVPPVWLVGGGFFLPGVLPPQLGLPVLCTSPVLPQQWVVEAFGGVGPHVCLGLGPSGDEVVVWRRPVASNVRVDAWFTVGGCHPGYMGSVRVGRGGRLGTRS